MTSKQIDMLEQLFYAECSPRELDFLDDLDQHWRKRDLTEKRRAWLERIWRRCCG